MRNEAKSKEEKPLALNRMVRSAIAGSAGEPYCAYIIDRIQEVCDLSDWPLSEVEAIWEEAAKSDKTVEEFCAYKQAQLIGGPV